MSSKDVSPPDLCTRWETVSVFLNSLLYKHPWKDSPIQKESVPLLQDVYKQEQTTGNCCPTLRRKQRRKNPPIFIWEISIFFVLIGVFEKVECVLASKVQFTGKQMMGPTAKIFLPLFMANTWNATLYFSLCEKYYAIPKVFLLEKK